MRGSCPCGGEEHRRYGGNTACVVVEAPGTTTPLILDLGTGLRGVGLGWPGDRVFQGVALVSHLHWDHLQGLPFFSPLDREGAVLDVYGPAQEDASLAAAVKDALRPPYFPVRLEDLAGQVRFHDLGEDDLALGDAKVRVRAVPHLGTTLGYRVELGGVSLAYVSDHQAPRALDRVDDAVLELCDGVDLLVHDAQYTDQEFAAKAHWGHCTVGYAVRVAQEAGARRLALFHHDPAHDDRALDRLESDARRLGETTRLGTVVAAAEGMVLELGP